MILTLFLLLGGAGAWSQNGLPSSGLPKNLRSTRFRPAQEQRQELRTAQSSLPDAPSAVPESSEREPRRLWKQRSPLMFDGAADQFKDGTRIAGVLRAQSNAQL